MHFEKIGIWMDLSFSTFSAADRRDFLNDLAEVSGFTEKEIKNTSFWEGCVKFEADIEEKAVDLIIEIYQDLKTFETGNKDILPESIEKMKVFIKKYNIKSIRRGGLDGRNATIFVRNNTEDSEDRDAIFFVHGWRGDIDTFGSLPDYLASELDMESLVYSYPTGFSGHTPSLYYIAQNLDNWVRNRIKSEKRRISFIGHSMGGIVIRKMLGSQLARERPIDDKIKQITFIASPHTGVWIAKAAKYISGTFQMSELGPDSPMLADVTTTWHAWLRRNDALSHNIRSIYGTKDSVVDEVTAMGTDPEAVPILGAGHKDIVKPQQRTDEIVLTVSRFLREAETVHARERNALRDSKSHKSR